MVGKFSSSHISDGYLGDSADLPTVNEIRTKSGNLTWRKNGAGFWDGWLYGNVDAAGEFTGNEIAYIYADLTTVIYGKFEKGILVEGRQRKVKEFRYLSRNSARRLI